MSEKAQLLLTAIVPSILVILSWIHNNTRLSRLEARVEAGLDAVNRRIDTTNQRMDDLVRGFHSDMMGFSSLHLGSQLPGPRTPRHRRVEAALNDPEQAYPKLN